MMSELTLDLAWSFFQRGDRASEAPDLVVKEHTPEKPTRIVCAQCGRQISTRDQLFAYDGAQLYGVFINPFGVVFELCTLMSATNLIALGTATEEGTWFEGYAWQVCVCDRCRTHLGWLYRGHTSVRAPTRFYGLIRSKLREA